MTAPNILFILADDLGWADLGVYGATDFATPHLDRLAAQGVRFTQAYANSAVCSATRLALITGRYHYRLRAGLEEPLARYGSALGLLPEHPTLPSLLQQAGYDTALIGKWHLGQPPAYGPLRSGYGYFFGNHHGAIDYFTHQPGVGPQFERDLWQGEQPVERTGYYTYLLGDEAVRYVQARQGQAKPFFLSLHFTAPHWPWEGPEDEHVAHRLQNLFHYDGGGLKKYGEIVGALDRAVGQVLQALDETGQAENTIVIFTSDNGGERFSKTWPFTGQKTELLEGGIRVPTLLRWSARISPQVQEQVTASFDWLPTLLAAAGASPHPDYPSDGQNMLPFLLGQAAPTERTLYWRYRSQAQRALRQGPWKYLKINAHEFLFNLDDDPRERANLKDVHPQRFAQLRQQWEDWNLQWPPATDGSYSHGLSPDIQADRYVPERLVQG
jgi:arylsulfatase A-like enzyme